MISDEDLLLLSSTYKQAAKTQRACNTTRISKISELRGVVSNVLDTIRLHIENAQPTEGKDAIEVALKALKRGVKRAGTHRAIHKSHKETYMHISKFRKAVDKCFPQHDEDLNSNKADTIFRKPTPDDQVALHQAIEEHLQRSGEEAAVNELRQSRTCESLGISYEGGDQQFSVLVQLMDAVDRRDISYLLRWVSDNQEHLQGSGNSYTALEFNLHCLEFERLALTESALAAVVFARRSQLGPRACRVPKFQLELQQLMTSLLFLSDDMSKHAHHSGTASDGIAADGSAVPATVQPASKAADCVASSIKEQYRTLSVQRWAVVRREAQFHGCRLASIPLQAPLQTCSSSSAKSCGRVRSAASASGTADSICPSHWRSPPTSDGATPSSSALFRAPRAAAQTRLCSCNARTSSLGARWRNSLEPTPLGSSAGLGHRVRSHWLFSVSSVLIVAWSKLWEKPKRCTYELY